MGGGESEFKGQEEGGPVSEPFPPRAPLHLILRNGGRKMEEGEER